MLGSSRLAAAALAAALLFGAGQASAASFDDRCLWTALPKARQTLFIDHFNRTGFQGLKDLPFGDADVLVWSDQCKVPNKDAVAAGYLLGTYVMENASAQVLEARWGVKRADLDRAWANLPAGVKAAAKESLQATLTSGSQGDREAFPAAARALAAALKLSDDGARTQTLYFVFAVLARELKLEEMA